MRYTGHIMHQLSMLCKARTSAHTTVLVYKALVVPTLLYAAAESWALS